MRKLVFAIVVVAIVAVGVAIYRGSGPLPDPEGCHAKVQGHQVDIALDQGENATLIAAIGVKRDLPARAVSIALATGFQESKLRNLHGGDRDSLGIFQQRPSQGWGSPKQVLNPYYSINAFYDALQKVDGYQGMRITEAAQQVQRSGFPEAYDAHASDARALASALTGYSAGGQFSCVVHDDGSRGTARRVMHTLSRAYGRLDLTPGPRQDVTVDLPTGPAGKRLGWSVAQFLVAHAGSLHLQQVSFHHRTWHIGRPSEDGWTHSSSAPAHEVRVSLG